MENTTRDFWKMVMDYEVPAVVMLCDLVENDQVQGYIRTSRVIIWEKDAILKRVSY